MDAVTANRYFIDHRLAEIDIECVSMFGKSRGETLQRLRANADSQLSQASTGFGKRQ